MVLTKAGVVRAVKAFRSRPILTWLQFSGIDTVAPSLAGGDGGTAAVQTSGSTI